MRRFVPFTLLFGLLSGLILACTAPAAPSDPTTTLDSTRTPVPTAVPATPTEDASTFPVTRTDDLGRDITVEARPERIVSLAPSNTEILFAIGAGEQVVGVTEHCNYPPEVQERTSVGGFSAKNLSVETIVAQEPDLVVSAGSIQQPVIDALTDAGITVFALDPSSIDDVYANIETVGAITGHSEEARTVIDDVQSRITAVTDVTDDIPAGEQPAVFYEVWNEPLMTAGPTTFIGALIDLAGGKNIFADVEEDYPQVSTERVVQRNPDIILGPDSHSDQLTVAAISERPGWEDIDAVQNDQIYLIDGDIVSRAGPRLAQALETIAATLHPDRFE